MIYWGIALAPGPRITVHFGGLYNKTNCKGSCGRLAQHNTLRTICSVTFCILDGLLCSNFNPQSLNLCP